MDVDRVEPQYDHGILTITVPKAEEKKARQLEVKVGRCPSGHRGTGFHRKDALAHRWAPDHPADVMRNMIFLQHDNFVQATEGVHNEQRP